MLILLTFGTTCDLRLLSTDYWYQEQLLTAILHSLGCHLGYSHDEEGYRTKKEEIPIQN